MKQAIIKIIILLNFAFNQAFSQKLIYSDIFNGKVEVLHLDSYDVVWSNDINNYPIEITNNISNLKKAILIYNYYKIVPINNFTEFTYHPYNDKTIRINNIDYPLNYDDDIQDFFLSTIANSSNAYIFSSVRMKNVTNSITSQYINVELTKDEYHPTDNDYPRFNSFSLLLIFEDNDLEKTSINIFANTDSVSGNIEHIYNLPPINLNKDIGISLKMIEMMREEDCSYIYIYDNYIGNIWGPFECNNTGSELFGNFIYENGTLFGLCDDTANETMNGSDVLANIKQYFTDNTFLKLNSIYCNETGSIPAGKFTNPILYTYIAYTPNCDVFETQTSQDTVICLGESAPIFASGGQAYEWEPQIGLSCYDCPNPIFNHDSTITYTVRIWNNDSCSKVLPVRVRVHKPQAPQISTTPSLCADSTGSVTFSGLSEFNAPYTYHLLGMSNASGSFANVPPGEHTYSITDKYGCVYEGTATVGVITPKAQFTANPEQGQEPLTVTFNNSSQNANGYIWIIGTDTFSTQSHTHTFDTAGQYQVLLIAYNNNPECSDTAMFTVNVFAQFYVLIPNIFTPNGDGVNDEFTFEASRIREAEWEIFNRWGNTLHKGDWSTEQAFFNDTHIIPVWNGITQRNEPPPDGVYFYKITVKTLNNVFETFTGNVTLVR